MKHLARFLTIAILLAAIIVVRFVLFVVHL